MIGTMIAVSCSMRYLRQLSIAAGISMWIPSMAQPFPVMEGETLAGARTTLPNPGGAPHTLIALAYGQKAAPLLEDWFEPLYLRFVAKHGLFAQAIHADVYFIPLFVGGNKAAYEPTLRKFRKSATPELLDRILFVHAGMEDVQAPLGLKDKEVPYFFILDRSGAVIHRTQGAFSEDKLEEMEEVLLQ
jgi:hypothetical protein